MAEWITDLALRVQHAHLHLTVVRAIGFAEAKETGLDAEHQVVEGLRAGNQVERGRESPTLIKVGEPQLCTGKLPLNVSIFLYKYMHMITEENKTRHIKDKILILVGWSCQEGHQRQLEIILSK